MSLAAYEPTWQHERRGYIRCRAIGHSWFDYDSNWTPSFGDPLTLRCERCGMERRDTVNWNGDLINRHYYKPVSYNLDRDDYKPTRADFRLMLLAIRNERPAKRKKVAS